MVYSDWNYFLILFRIVTALSYLFNLLNLTIVSLFFSLILVSYTYMYYAKAVALFYMPN